MARRSSALAWGDFEIGIRLIGLQLGADVFAHIDIGDVN